MKCDKKTMLLYAVTDRAWTGKQSLYEQVEAALKGGATCVQLREKELDEETFLQEAKDIAALCKRYGVPFFVNDNVEIAIACHADGIHVGIKTVSYFKSIPFKRIPFPFCQRMNHLGFSSSHCRYIK